MPCGPCGPVAPVAPFGPAGPSAPFAPCGPSGPVGPVAPVGPCGPSGPGTPATFHWRNHSVPLQLDSPSTTRIEPLLLPTHVLTKPLLAIALTTGPVQADTDVAPMRRKMMTKASEIRDRRNTRYTSPQAPLGPARSECRRVSDATTETRTYCAFGPTRRYPGTAATASAAVSSRYLSSRCLQDVDGGEQTDPDHIDEMPVDR